MAWKNDFSLLKLSVSRWINIYSTDNKQKVQIKVPSAKELFGNNSIREFFNYIRSDVIAKFKQLLVLWKVENSYDWLKIILIDSASIKDFAPFREIVQEALAVLIPDLWVALDRTLMIRDVEVDQTLWLEIANIWKISNADKDSKETAAKKVDDFHDEVRKQQEIIERMKKKEGKGESNEFMKVFLWIRYSFPTYTDEELWNKTMYEIIWLQRQAIQATTYEVEKLAYANGNFKKNQKLTFFLNKK